MTETQTSLGTGLPGLLWLFIQGSIAFFIADKLWTKPRSGRVRQPQGNQNDNSLSKQLSKSYLARGLVAFSLLSQASLVCYMLDTNQIFHNVFSERKDTLTNFLKSYSHLLIPIILAVFSNFTIKINIGFVKKMFLCYIIGFIVLAFLSYTITNIDTTVSSTQEYSAYDIRNNYTPQTDYYKYSAQQSESADPQSSKEEQASKTKSKKDKSKPKPSRQKESESVKENTETVEKKSFPMEKASQESKEQPQRKPKPKPVETTKPAPKEDSEDKWDWVSIIIEIIKVIIDIMT